ncbi:hypothetical protein [Ralstonia pseudosolanacearum]|uniref:hypothetical protein n=1 Tax=Ralstonia pseudosolanacearum TaxID=1310165 RepID=UPI004053FEF9
MYAPPVLPSSCYVPFEVQRLANAQTVYRISGSDDGTDWAANVGWAVRSELESDADFCPERATALGERYGGAGVGRHGGGGRCGLIDGYQVKGIGRTPLLGHDEGSDDGFWHAHGGLSMVDAIQEAIWSGVFGGVLPYGAVRVHAIVATGTQCHFEKPGGIRSQHHRALLVRDPVIRPAHFARACFFQPPSGVSMEPDPARVVAALTGLPTALPLPSPAAQADSDDILLAGLQELARRGAVQLAIAASRRLMHGALNGANVAVDGRWIDFGTATSLPHFENTKSYGLPRFLPCFWEEPAAYGAALRELLYYVGKYGTAAGLPRIEASTVLTAFQRWHGFYLARSFLWLTGMPEPALDLGLREPAVRSLAAALLRHASTYQRRRVLAGQEDLGLLAENHLARAAHAWACAQAQGTLGAEFDDPWFQGMDREDLRDAFGAAEPIWRSIAARAGVTSPALAKYRTIVTLKACTRATWLDRHELARTMVRVAEPQRALDPAKIQSFIDTTVQQSLLVLAPHPDWRVTLWTDRRGELGYDAQRDAWWLTSGTQMHWSREINEQALPPEALSVYGSELVKVLAPHGRIVPVHDVA